MIHTIGQARDANRRAGYHFFNADAMRSFGSRLPRKVYPVATGALFVTSEQWHTYDRPEPRLYTVRHIGDDGRTETIGEFQGWETSASANRFAGDLAKVWTDATYLADVRCDDGSFFPVAVLSPVPPGRAMVVPLRGGWSLFTIDETALINAIRFGGETGEVAR